MPQRTAPQRFSLFQLAGIAAINVVLICPFSGCLVPATRIDTCQARYHKLAEENKSLQTSVANLEAECSKLQAERDQSEQELVFLDREVPAIFARLQNITQPPRSTGKKLATLAADTEGLRFDPTRGTLQRDPELFFEAGNSLKVETGDSLGGLASVLSAPELQSHRVLIVIDEHQSAGSSRNQSPLQQAERLVDFFHQWGIPEDRIGISSYRADASTSHSNGAKMVQQTAPATSMEIYLLADDVPIIGWNTPGQSLKR